VIALVIKATVLLCVGLAAVRLAHRARAAVRHAMLLATLTALAVLPAGVALMPALDIAVLPAPDTLDTVLPAAAGSPSPSRLDNLQASRAHESTARVDAAPGTTARTMTLTRVAFAVWAAGAATVLLSLLAGVIRVSRVRRTALPCRSAQPLVSSLAAAAGFRKHVDVVVHDALVAPIACGVSRPTIVLPADAEDWTPPALSRALVHELEHVRRRDWPTQMGARALCAVYWFHPLMWMVYRQLCLEAEHACDDAVVAREESTMYADQLVTLARRMASHSPVAMLGMAHRSDLAARVTAILDASKARGRAGIMRTGAAAVAAAMLVAAIAPLHLVANSEPAAAQPATAPAAADDTRIDLVGTRVDDVATDGSRSAAASTRQDRERVSRLDRALVEAAAEGDINDVRELLDKGGNVNAAVAGDGSPLIVAARGGHLALVRLLLERGADVNQVVRGDGTALIMAAREGHLEVVRLLLDQGADINLVAEDDENALIQSSAAGEMPVTRLLVERGADVNARVFAQGYGRRDGEWRTPLAMAIRGGHRAIAEFLRAHGATE
jgi:beta-lactamase regulating signal transducer with metallopeptidase domain